MVTDGNGKFYEQIEYFPYGETWIHNKANTEQTSTPYKFTSKELDEETGLYYYGARYYDARLSRWVSADPALVQGRYFPSNDKEKNLLGSGGIFNLINLDAYHYAGNNPVKLVDPDGNITIAIEYNIFDTYGNVAIQINEGSSMFKFYDKWVTHGVGKNNIGNDVAIESGFYEYSVDKWTQGPSTPRLYGKNNSNLKGNSKSKGGYIKTLEKNPYHKNKEVATGIRIHRMREKSEIKKNDPKHGGKDYYGSEGCHGPVGREDFKKFMEGKKVGDKQEYLLIRPTEFIQPATGFDRINGFK